MTAKRLSYALIIAFTFAVALLRPGQTVDAAPALTEDSPFASEIFAFLVRDEVLNPAPCSTLFVGSSSIRFWFTLEDDFSNRTVLQNGFGGAHLTHVIDYFDLIVTPHKPKEIVLYAGENDINAGKAVAAVVSDLETLLALKSQKLGETPVYFISIKPSKARFGEFNKQSEANQRIRTLAETRGDLVFIDIVPSMMEGGRPKNIFIRDDLHMTLDGYRLWAGQVAAALDAGTSAKSPHCGAPG